MTPSELHTLGLTAWGHQWQAPLARALGVNPRTVRRWASGKTPISDRISAEIRKVLGDESALPPDEWITGHGDGGREYIVHTRRPRFLARVTGEAVGDIIWLDPPPTEHVIRALMDDAARVVMEGVQA